MKLFFGLRLTVVLYVIRRNNTKKSTIHFQLSGLILFVLKLVQLDFLFPGFLLKLLRSNYYFKLCQFQGWQIIINK